MFIHDMINVSYIKLLKVTSKFVPLTTTEINDIPQILNKFIFVVFFYLTAFTVVSLR